MENYLGHATRNNTTQLRDIAHFKSGM